MNEVTKHPTFAQRFINLAQPRLGAAALFASDDFFAPCERMLQPSPAVFIPGKYDDNGKWMDGWESRRKREPGHDYCVVKLACAGKLHGVDIDTSHFVGNHPPAASLDACYVADGSPDEQSVWAEVLPETVLQENAHHLCGITDPDTYNHVRLNIYPDGGIARLRVYGEVIRDWHYHAPDELVDLAAVGNGGLAVACSEAGFGSSMHNLNLPGRGLNMGDGWETPRRRGPGHDWVILALGHAGIIRRLEIDTAHYKGNYPDRVSVQATNLSGTVDHAVIARSDSWPTILPEQKLTMDAAHIFEAELRQSGTVTHVRVNVLPDGGLSRVRVFGVISNPGS